MDDFFRVEGVTKSFGRLLALNRVSFEVRKGEVLGLIGPNGAGKTTLFNVITCFYYCDSGAVIFKGKNVTKESPNRLAEMGLIRTFQIPRPFNQLTVHDNVAVGTLFDRGRIERFGVPKEAFISNILEGVRLTPYGGKLASVLGYGNKKLLELGRAQGPAPEFLLLDEPFAGLSRGEIESASDILRSLTQQGLTIMIVEHKLRELMKLVSRVIVLYYGEKIADASPDDIARDERVLKAYLGRRWSREHA
jgi:ABC-type branched-subunit amino acid transport system ATPase component